MKKIPLILAGLIATVVGLAPLWLRGDEAADRAAMEKTMVAITKGFAEGDVDAVMRYHHPDVAKALNYRKVLVGREAVKADMTGTFRSFKVEFIEHEIESLLIQGDYAIEQTRFAVKGTPKSGGDPWVFRGRAMVVYVRYAGSPTGWASLREMVQPATE
ncbi:MAG TPA: nuclear transport factor 2 family protein [Lacunisphaera sp.]|nr:nuclear transport factor 2 family protein [Lacunisphaera sp.]